MTHECACPDTCVISPMPSVHTTKDPAETTVPGELSDKPLSKVIKNLLHPCSFLIGSNVSNGTCHN